MIESVGKIRKAFIQLDKDVDQTYVFAKGGLVVGASH